MSISLQELFDRVATHLLTQKKRAVGPVSCLYRTPDGLKCAVGCLISDEHYSPKLEGRSVFEPSIEDALSRSLGSRLEESHLNLLYDLQGVHDSVDVDRWNSGLAAVAEEHDLDSSILRRF